MGITPSSSQVQIETFTEPPKAPTKPLKTGISPKCSGRLYSDPGKAIIIDGESYPETYFRRAEPGVNGCSSRSDLDAVDAYAKKNGCVPIPLDLKVIAWDQEVTGYVTRTLALVSGEEKVYHYHTVWERFVTLGSTTVREFDMPGWVASLARIRDYIGGIHPLIDEAGRAFVRARADLFRESPSPADQRTADKFEATLNPPKKAPKKAPEPKPE